ncbi:MAG: Replication-associated recombination protein RarA [uncultured Thermomicrobiales bacterium]|uniref:Replication-associated recombination protein A n=1 Tax=uncultured Thermomicrobiales bacterium TaxID=1645740 RepID=A0A6J4VHN6_9BACT|nr:MAG: Replication-associated recombination protein RarA [uncultured Thermomicrobiales bacterium]
MARATGGNAARLRSWEDGGAATQDLFAANREERLASRAPLATRMRPRTLDELVGQAKVVGPGTLLRRAIEADRLSSLVLWGPPGTGKTTLARIIANTTEAHFAAVSAVTSGVADLRAAIREAGDRLGMHGQRTVLFIDEIHRFNKGQQDAILPHVEDGTVVLIGATTENPSFEVNAPLLSRSRVVVLRPLTDDDVRTLILRALGDRERGLGDQELKIGDDALDLLANLANGDARFALNTLEFAATGAGYGGDRAITVDLVAEAAQRRAATYDKGGDDHFDTISALHKTLRGSDPDAALYWLARMLERGDDPLYVARRLVRFASEDVGLADPTALPLAMAAQQAVHFLGLPEASLALAELTVHLALAPKSNAVYAAYKAAQADVAETRNDPVPLHLRNAATGLMRDLGYGDGYKYAHDFEGGVVAQQNLPENLAGRRYYRPTDRGHEAELGRRLERVRAIYEPSGGGTDAATSADKAGAERSHPGVPADDQPAMGPAPAQAPGNPRVSPVPPDQGNRRAG